MKVEENQSTGTLYAVLTRAKYPYPQSAPGNVVIIVALSVVVPVALAGDTVMATALPVALADTSPSASAGEPASSYSVSSASRTALC